VFLPLVCVWQHDVNSDALLDADEFVSMLQDVWVETTVRSPG
jgi:hypothetical protein